MSTEKVAPIPFHVEDHLDTREVVVEYFKGVVAEGSPSEIDEMLLTVANSKYVKNLTP